MKTHTPFRYPLPRLDGSSCHTITASITVARWSLWARTQNCVLEQALPPRGSHRDDGLMSACEDVGGLLFIVPHRPRPCFPPCRVRFFFKPHKHYFFIIENGSPFSFFVAKIFVGFWLKWVVTFSPSRGGAVKPPPLGVKSHVHPFQTCAFFSVSFMYI